MERFIINGEKELSGEIRVNGAKNAALKILAASLLTDKVWTVSNVPQIEDIFRLIELLKGLGVEIKNGSKGIYQLEAKKIKADNLDFNIASKLKGSILMAGPLLSRCGEANFYQAGGCVIGQRPRDIFLDSFKSLVLKLKKKAMDIIYQLSN